MIEVRCREVSSRVDFGRAPPPPVVELTVRVMDAGGLRGDRPAGEARVALHGDRGQGTFRLLGGGYATLSLRWSTRPCGQRPSAAEEEKAFERAIGFWSQPRDVTQAQLELAALLSTEGDSE